MLQEALNIVRRALEKPEKSLRGLQEAFEKFEENGPFKDDRDLEKIKQVKDRKTLYARHSNRNPWYEYVLKRIAIPEWFQRLEKSVHDTKTIEQWNAIRKLYLWDEILGDLVNKAPYLDEAGESKGMCESFRNFLISMIDQNSGEKALSLIFVKEKLELFIKDLKGFRDQYQSFQETQIKSELDFATNELQSKLKKYATPKNQSIWKIQNDVFSARDAVRVKTEEFNFLKTGSSKIEGE